MTEFLMQADPAERNELESSRVKLLNLMKSAQAEQEQKYPATTAETVLTRRQVAQAKIKSGCKAFSEVTYEYSKMMDLLVAQAPEYVSLVWGAIKIVLVVQINHEELKQKVKEYMEQIKIRFEIVDHLTAYMPKANLVTSVAKAYELFSRFLAKAVKYYSLNRFSECFTILKHELTLIHPPQRQLGERSLNPGRYICRDWSTKSMLPSPTSMTFPGTTV